MIIDIDGEVLGHLLILQHKNGGTLSDQIQLLLDRADPQLRLDLGLPAKTRRRLRRDSQASPGNQRNSAVDTGLWS